MCLDPQKEIEKRRHHLPHWQQDSTWIFVTFRLGDSLPAAKLTRWREERAIWTRLHPEPWTERTENEYHERFSKSIDAWLDAGSGSCLLRDPANAKIVADALLHFHDERYELTSFVVMPNHVHILFSPNDGHPLASIVQSWKGFTARAINRRLDRKGPLWQEDYFDRLIRSIEHYHRTDRYIRENPKKLRPGEFILWP